MSDSRFESGAGPIWLTLGQRLSLGALGAAFACVAIWAELVGGHDGVGTVAFVGVGGVLLTLGILGRFPNRISSREYAAVFEAEVDERAQRKAAEAVGELVEELPSEARTAIARSTSSRTTYTPANESLTSSSGREGALSSGRRTDSLRSVAWEKATSSLAFERDARSRLWQILHELGFVKPSDQSGSSNYDIEARAPNGATLIVELKQSVAGYSPRDILGQVGITLGDLSSSRYVLIVTRGEKVESFQRRISELGRPTYVGVANLDWSDRKISGQIKALMDL